MAQNTNVVFILADDLGYGDLSIYGSADINTPNIDALASNGIKFNRAYANSTVCSPSRASILFGDYPDLLGVPGVIRDASNNSWGNLRDDLTSLPEVLKDQGLATALVGKWHLGYESPDTPNERGFDFFHGFLGDMMDDYYTHERGGMNWMRKNDQIIEPTGHATDVFTNWATNYIARQAESEQPFFLFLAYNAPHSPIQPPEEYLNIVEKRYPSLSLKRKKLIALIEHMDDGVGRMIQALKTHDMYENTIIVFASDNGGALQHGASNRPFNGGKGDMLEGGIRVPCILTWPSKLRENEYDEPMLLMDWYRLLPRLANGEIKSTTELFEALKKEKHEHMIWVRREGHRFGGLAYYAVSDGRYKLVQNSPFEPFMLYDLQNDGKEMLPLEKPDIHKSLLKVLTKHIQTSGSIPWQ
ncbi:MAG: sulfatase-like hydrolase/transferase [Bacteroidota bacterium]